MEGRSTHVGGTFSQRARGVWSIALEGTPNTRPVGYKLVGGARRLCNLVRFRSVAAAAQIRAACLEDSPCSDANRTPITRLVQRAPYGQPPSLPTDTHLQLPLPPTHTHSAGAAGSTRPW
jgi:hypothetical protein